ncbi:MAG: PAS domain S-box protein [Chloroflexota bacterium]|nr:PAS domain S-box protein [Chloroflexota bacterium]
MPPKRATDRERAEAKFESLLAFAPDAIVVVTHQGAIVLVNAQAEALFGYSRAEMLGQDVELLVPEALRTIHRRHRATYAEKPQKRGMGIGLELLGRRRDGTEFPVEISLGPLETEAGPLVAAAIRDISDRKLVEERARLATQRWQDLTGDAIITTDGEGHIVTWNAGAEQMLGWRRHEVLGSAWVPVPPDLMDEARSLQAQVIRDGQPISYETERMTKDGRRLPVMGTLAPLPGGDGPGTLLIFKDLTAHRLLDEQAQALARLQERERIAMDLHDGIIQSLYGIAMSLGAERLKSGRAGERRSGTLLQAQTRLNDAIEEVRRYISELRPHMTGKRDLEGGITALAEQFRLPDGPSVTVELARGAGQGLAADVVDHVLYIAHEALSNAVRHANASRIRLTLRAVKGSLSLSISDDGCGFNVGKRGRRSGDGLRNMALRADHARIELTVSSEVGRGTTITVSLPRQ